MSASFEMEVFRHLLAAIPEEMGVVLQKSAYSPNIKERRDYSCALFDPRGAMIAQAAHIPVHLGAMSLSVAAALREIEDTARPRCASWVRRWPYDMTGPSRWWPGTSAMPCVSITPWVRTGRGD